MDVGRGRMFSLNPVASRMLELMKADANQCQIVEVIAREFTVSPETAAKDLIDFLAALMQDNLIEVLE
jgi:hypothetical protein